MKFYNSKAFLLFLTMFWITMVKTMDFLIPNTEHKKALKSCFTTLEPFSEIVGTFKIDYALKKVSNLISFPNRFVFMLEIRTSFPIIRWSKPQEIFYDLQTCMDNKICTKKGVSFGKNEQRNCSKFENESLYSFWY